MVTQMSSFNFNHYSRFDRVKHDKQVYAWCVFLDEPKSVLDDVIAVEYILHPTFPDPIRRISDRAHCFALESEAWGGFGIEIRIFLSGGEIERARYYIKLEDDNWARGLKLEKFPDSQTELLYTNLFHDRFDWRKISTLVRIVGIPEEQVAAKLVNLSKDGFVRKAYFKSVDKQELWGATYNDKVRILPTPNE